MSLTTDPNDPKLREGQQNKEGQHSIYLVLSEEEMAKGFVRPYRDQYTHVGRKLNYSGLDRILTEEEKKEYPDKDYVALLLISDENGNPLGSKYCTQDEVDAWKEGKRYGGCGTSTTMARAIAETYARDPKFYGSTFCVNCNKHLPVEEFVWAGTDQTVGS